MPNINPRPAKAVVAVIQKDDQLLAIKRSEFVRAPGKICFPGGGIEPGETAESAVVREVREELGVGAEAIRQIWQSISPWNVELFWWLASIEAIDEFDMNVEEVAWCGWLTIEQMRQSPDLLVSNLDFFQALESGQFQIG